MTKFNDLLRNFIDEWFENKKILTKSDYDMLRNFANEVLKENYGKGGRIKNEKI